MSTIHIQLSTYITYDYRPREDIELTNKPDVSPTSVDQRIRRPAIIFFFSDNQLTTTLPSSKSTSE
jgi:hypothetical protein